VRGKQTNEIKVVVVPVRDKTETAKPEKKNHLQAIASLITAVVAVFGIFLSFRTMTIQRETALSNRLSSAIARMHDESYAVRIGALYEFIKLAEDSPRDRSMIVEILTKFVREGIENTPRNDKEKEFEKIRQEYLLEEMSLEDIAALLNEKFGTLALAFQAANQLARPNDDIFLAANVLSSINAAFGLTVNLEGLKGDNLNLDGIALRRARLSEADFRGTHLYMANLEGAHMPYADFREAYLNGAKLQNAYCDYAKFHEASLTTANLQDAEFRKAVFEGATFTQTDLKDAKLFDADLRGVNSLTVEQLLVAYINQETLLDLDLRSDPRIQAKIDEWDEIMAELGSSVNIVNIPGVIDDRVRVRVR